MDDEDLVTLHAYARTEEAAAEDSHHDDEANYSTGDDDNFDVNNPPALPHLREISSLASWAVSSYKPGCGVTALRHPSPSFYWQSDGPQPHTLNIHFFKLVSIVHMRIYLNFELDESYTPTRLIFLAGTGHHDLQVVREMDLRQPKGWLDVDLHSAGGPSSAEEGVVVADFDEDSDEIAGMSEEDLKNLEKDRARQNVGMGPSLRCFLVQLRILENHHNGKDTHLRGLQIFARDTSRGIARGNLLLQNRKGGASVESTSARHEAKQKPRIGLENAEFLNATIR